MEDTPTSGALVTVPDPKGMALMVSMFRQAFAPDMRQRRDDFEMMADSNFFDKLIKVACYMEGLHHYRRGADRYRVFTFGFIRATFDKALESLGASSEVNIDQMYFDALPDEIKARPDPELQDLGGNLSRDEFTVDWVGMLQGLEHKYPGFVVAMYSGVDQQTKTQENMRSTFQTAMSYTSRVDGQLPAISRLGKDILKARRAPSAGGGGRIIY